MRVWVVASDLDLREGVDVGVARGGQEDPAVPDELRRMARHRLPHLRTHHTPLATGCTSQGAPNEQALPGRTEQALPGKEGAGCQAHGEEAARGREEEVLLARGEEDV